MIGQTISHYKILEKLGEGGMGVVYKAEDTILKRMVALKLLPVHALGSKEEKARFMHEAQAAAALNHPNICTIYEIDEANGESFIVMEFVEGQNLKKTLQTGPMPIDEVIDYAIQIANGLGTAHAKGIIHRDMKCDNVMIDDKNQVKIMDFGLAKKAGQTMLTKEGTTIGTISYMSPEQARGEDVDHRTDIWSLGVMLYEMILGRLPFKGEYEQAIVYSVMNEDPEPITSLRTGVPIQLEQYVNKCLAKEPEDRYPASDGLIVDLRQLKKDTSATAQTKTETDPKVQTKQDKKSSITLTANPKFKKVLIGLVSAVVVVLGVFVFWKFLPKEAPKLFENRVAVAYFENESGDSSLDYLRRRTADHLTQGIGTENFVEVAALVPENEIDLTKPSIEQLRLLSDKTGANIIVSGVFYKEGNKLTFQAEVNNITTGKLLRSLPHITGTASDPTVLLDDLLQRVLSFLGFKFDIPWKTYSDYMGYIPTYDAFKEYKEGWDLYYNLDFMESIERYQKALELDSTFIHAYLMIAIVFYDGGFNAQADSMVQFLDEIRNDFTLNERKVITWLKAMLHNDLTGYLQVCREIAEFDADWQWNTGWGAFRVNRLSEAEEWFAQVDPDKSGLASSWESFWSNYCATLHMLGKHEAERQVVHDRRQRFPESRNAFVDEIIVHIALDNLQSALDLKRDIYVPMERMNPGQGLILVAQEFAAHGFEKEALESIEEAIRWFTERPESERAAHRVSLFVALGFSVFTFGTEESLQQTEEQKQRRIPLTSNREERIQLMRQIAQELVQEQPSNENYQGRLGIFYAQLGERDNASRIFKLLGKLDRRFLHGKNIYWQAAIAAQLGELSRAVTLLYDAQSKGNAFGNGFHRDLVWKPLSDYPGFKEFMRPKK